MAVLRLLVVFLALLGQLSLGAPARAQIQAPEPLPPLSPDAETITVDASFSENCLATVNDFIARSNGRLQWELGRPLVTLNDKWGLVWRVDFNDGGSDLAPYINRIVCWKTPGTDKLNIQVALLMAPALETYLRPSNGR